ncbi:arginase family protein [Salinactinospora qingdaonensis]|uniref:Arginase n=1 Tax=Salinactinospora qingdaonensis TaxID=702744 RepID=A0ABP7GNF7_9ACTN
MVWQRDVDLVVPLWQGGDDVRAAAGAAALARIVPTGQNRLHVSVPDGERATLEGVRNLEVLADTVRQLRDRIAKRAPTRALTLGGDGLSDLATLEHLTRVHPGTVVYWMGAHAAAHTPASCPTGAAHHMGLRLLLGEGHPRLATAPGLTPGQVTLVGARELDPAEEEFVRATGLAWMDPVQVIADPTDVVKARPAGSPAYVHLDLDVCDGADLPAVARPSTQGPRVESVATALRTIAAHHDVVGVGVGEYVPVVEHDSAKVALLLHALDLAEAPVNDRA